MAHECPECYMLCHCNGDIDDIMIDTKESYLRCQHYLSPDCAGYDYPDDDYDDYDPQGEARA
jgi:hypothetical protein